MQTRRPVVGIALATAVGMLVASTELIPFPTLFVLATSFIVLGFIFMRKTWPLVFISVALVGALRFSVSQPGLAADSINRPGETLGGKTVAIKGRISAAPRFFAYDDEETGTWSFSLNCQALTFSNHWQTASGQLDVQIHSASPALGLEPGDELELIGVLERKDFPGRNQYELNTSVDQFEVLRRSGGLSLMKWGRAWRNAMAPRLEEGLDGLSLQKAVLKALVLGYRQAMPPEVIAVFKRTGSLHIFAISGLHVGIVGLLLAMVLKMLGVPRGIFGVILIPLLGFYVISTGMKSSALRALLMAAVFLLAPLFKRKPDIPTSVSVAAILLLYYQPLEILSPGFIFSFTVVSFLVMVYSAVPKHWIQGSWIKSYTMSLGITSLAAGAVSIPLSALLFGIFSPIALIGNLIVVPLTFCIVLCGWLSILLPMVSSVFNHAAVIFIDLLLGSVNVLDRIPGSSWPVEPPSIMMVLLWYGSLIALFTACTNRKERSWALGMAGCAVVLALFG